MVLMVDGDWRPDFGREEERETNSTVGTLLKWLSEGEDSQEREVSM